VQGIGRERKWIVVKGKVDVLLFVLDRVVFSVI